MAHPTDPRLAEAKTIPMQDILQRLDVQRLHRAGGEMVGPCPVCGGTDRFGVNLRSNVFLCRRCDVGGVADCTRNR